MLGSFTIRRMRSAWLLVGCLAVTVVVTSALVSAVVSLYVTALPGTVSGELARSAAMSLSINGTPGGPPGRQAAQVAARLRAAFAPLPYRLQQATWSDDLALPGQLRSGPLPVIQAAAVGGITASARLTSGHWPGVPRPGQPIPAAVPASVAADLGLRSGSVLRLRDLTTGSPVTLQVTGLYRAIRPADPYWQLDLIGPSGVSIGAGFASYGPAVVSPAAFGSAAGARSAGDSLAAAEVSFVALPRVTGIKAGELTSLAGRVAAAASAINDAGQLTASTGMPQTLTNTAAALAAARSLVVISGLQLLLLVTAALGLAARLLASHREGETALLAARGGARWQLIRPSLAEAGLSVAVSTALGALAGGWLAAGVMAGLTAQPLRPAVPGWPTWLAAAVLALFCLGIATWPAAWRPRPSRARTRRSRPARTATAVRAGGDIALLVLAVLAVRELRSYTAAVHAGGGSSLDPVVAVAPTLALAALGVLALRLLPLAARELERLARRGTRLSSAMAGWAISRRPLRQSGPALLVIMAVGASTLALAQYQSWRRSVHDQAAYSIGAQVRVTLPAAEPASQAAAIAARPGVTAAMPVSTAPLAGSGQLLVLDAALAGRIVTLRADLAGRPVGQLFRAITTRARPGLVLPGRPARLEITASMSGRLPGPVSATLTVQDADGVAYAVPTSAMPADGRPHELIARLGSPGTGTAGPAGTAAVAAAYPLRLIGLSVGYDMPAYPVSAARQTAGAAAFQLDGIAVSPSATGPFRPDMPGRALAGWPAQAADPGLAAELAVSNGATNGATKPVVGAAAAAGSAYRVTFDPGNAPLLPSAPGKAPPLAAELDIDIPPPGPVPVIATAAFAAANGLHPGAPFAVEVSGEQVPARLAATVAGFPDGATLVADQAAVQDALASRGDGGQLPATQWWLATAGGSVPPGLPPGAAVSDAAGLARRLARDPLSAAPVRAAAAVAAVAALLAALGFCVSVAGSARERRPERALLSALGVPAGTQAGLFCLEEALVTIPAAAIGLAIGAGLARLVIPALILTGTGGPPVPPALVTLPLGWVLGIAACLPAVPVLAAALSTLRRPDPAAELRAAETMA